MEKIENFVQFKHPSTFLVAGSTGAGKSEYVKKIIVHVSELFYPSIREILWVCSTPPLWRHENVQFLTEIPDASNLDPSTPRLIIFDDYMSDGNAANKQIAKYFTKFSHHTNSSVFYLVQNVFNNADRFHRTISLNAHYLILFQNFRDRTQIQTLGHQLFPRNRNFLELALNDVTKNNPFAPLIVDLRPETNHKLRVRSNIFPDEGLVVVYQPTKI